MILFRNPVPVAKMSELLQRASATTGFSVSDIEELVACDLETRHLLDYITAIMSNRMN